MELPDRDSIEADFAARIRKLTARQRRELEDWIHATVPPDIANVPEWQWQKWEEESNDELLLILLLIAAASAELHGSVPGDDAVATALTGWATEHAAEVSASMARTTRERITATFEDIAERRAAADFTLLELDEAGRVIDSPASRDFAAELDEAFESLFGDKRAESVAVTETTAAQSAGGEVGVEMTVGKSRDDRWFTVNDAKVCPICTPLHQQPRSYWARFFPQGPPGPHPGCRCWIEYVNVGKELVTQ